MNKPHKHCAVIKAWADGATIEVYDPFTGWTELTDPVWAANLNYRIKQISKLDISKLDIAIEALETICNTTNQPWHVANVALNKIKNMEKIK